MTIENSKPKIVIQISHPRTAFRRGDGVNTDVCNSNLDIFVRLLPHCKDDVRDGRCAACHPDPLASNRLHLRTQSFLSVLQVVLLGFIADMAQLQWTVDVTAASKVCSCFSTSMLS